MTTTVKIEHVFGNKAIKVNTFAAKDLASMSGADMLRSGFTILAPGESAELLIHDSQQLVVSETGEFLD